MNYPDQPRPKCLPPIGIMPHSKWIELRRLDILGAIMRYSEAGLVIPAEWADELMQLEPLALLEGAR